MHLSGFYFVAILTAIALVLEPTLTRRIILSAGFKTQLWFLNLRLKFMAWRMYRQLVAMCKQHGFPAPGPFKYVDLWDR